MPTIRLMENFSTNATTARINHAQIAVSTPTESLAWVAGDSHTVGKETITAKKGEKKTKKTSGAIEDAIVLFFLKNKKVYLNGIICTRGTNECCFLLDFPKRSLAIYLGAWAELICFLH